MGKIIPSAQLFINSRLGEQNVAVHAIAAGLERSTDHVASG
jgi:hypothetical protein